MNVPLDALRRVERTSLAAMLRVLRDAAGAEAASESQPVSEAQPATEAQLRRALRVAPRHEWLLRRWLVALGEEQLLTAEQGRYRPAEPPGVDVDGLAADYRELGFPDGMARFHRAALDRLPELLRDEVRAQDLLFDGDDVLDALTAYQRNAFTDHLNETCAALVVAAASRRAPLRVVELGAGGGGTTEAVLRAVRAAGVPVEHRFTDVSRLFAPVAQRLGLAAELLDVDADFAAQGFAAGSADLVLAGNVLHNARHLGETLARVRALLAPGGELVCTESVRDNRAMLTSMQFLLSAEDGRDRHTDRRNASGEVFLDDAGWRAELRAAGFELRAVHPEPGSPWAAAGQLLFHAVRPGAADVADVLAELGDRVVLETGTATRTAARLRAALGGEPEADERVRGLLATLGAGTGLAAALGPEPGRTGVLTGDGVAAVWSAGGTAVLGDPAATPARLLAWLERSEVETAVLPAEQARALPDLPAALMTDLSALRRVVLTGAELTAAEAAAWAELDVEPRGAVAPRPAGDLAADVAAAADAEIAGLDQDAALDALRLVDAAALRSMLAALVRAGWSAAAGGTDSAERILDAAAVAPEHRALVRRWLVELARAGLLEHRDDGYAPVPGHAELVRIDDPWREARERWLAAFGAAETVDYARGSAEALPELITGRAQAVLLLFPEGRTDLARSLYRESITARYQQRAVAALVAESVRRAARPLRVLEVGAGTGATTEVVLDALGGARVDYLFTDVSRFFLDQARQRFGTAVRYGLFDLDAEPAAQDFDGGPFDLVLGAGALNAATDTDASVRRLRGLLAPGGLLVLTEPTTEEHWVMASQGLLMADAHDDRAGSGATFLSLPQWRAVLDGAGLHRELELPPPGHALEPLGHRVFVARA